MRKVIKTVEVTFDEVQAFRTLCEVLGIDTDGCVSMSFKEGPITFERLRGILEDENVEGFVFLKDGEPLCKIKKTDFGYKWTIPDVMNGHILK
jgi:hypothetical protein